MNPKHLNITDHAVDRYRERVVGQVFEDDKNLRRQIIADVKAKFVILGDGIYPIKNSHCAYVIKNSTIVTIIPTTKLSHDIMNNYKKKEI